MQGLLGRENQFCYCGQMTDLSNNPGDPVLIAAGGGGSNTLGIPLPVLQDQCLAISVMAEGDDVSSRTIQAEPASSFLKTGS